jgi:hypothetical protein
VAPAFSLLHCFRHRLSKLMLKLSCKMMGMRALTKQYGVGHTDDLLFIFPIRDYLLFSNKFSKNFKLVIT